MGEHTVRCEVSDGVGLVTIDRPDKRNALDADMHARLLAVLDRLRLDDRIRVVVLTGSGKSFVAGVDVAEFDTATPITMMQRLLHQPSVIEAADAFPKPLIAMINGYCLGSGNELAMACDIRIASEDARFGQPEVNLGMIPGGGATQRLPRLVGLGNAYYMMYTGAIIDSAEALRMGLVNQVVPAKQLKDRTMTLARMIAGKSPVALTMIKDAARASLRAPLDDGIRHEQSLAAIIFASADVREGLAAFREKRAPKFTGR